MRQIDWKATKAARERHAAGEARLRAFFDQGAANLLGIEQQRPTVASRSFENFRPRVAAQVIDAARAIRRSLPV